MLAFLLRVFAMCPLTHPKIIMELGALVSRGRGGGGQQDPAHCFVRLVNVRSGIDRFYGGALSEGGLREGRGMRIKTVEVQEALIGLSCSVEFSIPPISPPFSPRFPLVPPRFTPFFLHLYPLNHVTDFPLFAPLVKKKTSLVSRTQTALSHLLFPILGTLDP